MKPVNRELFDVDAVHPDTVATSTGGDALNAAVNLCKLGAASEVKFVGVVGDDLFGDFIIKSLAGRGVDTSNIKVVSDVTTCVSVVLIEESGERHFVYYGKCGNLLSSDQVKAAVDNDTEFLHLGSLMTMKGLEHEHLSELFAYCRDRGIKTSFDVTHDDTGEWLGRIKDGLQYTDTLFASYDEAVPLSKGRTKPAEMAEFFRGCGVKNFVLKLGGDGCYATDYNSVVEMSTYTEAPVVDTTGAGDAFVSGYLLGMLRGLTMEECCVLGNVNGSLGVGALGATTGTGTLDEVKSFIREYGAKSVKDSEGLLAKL